MKIGIDIDNVIASFDDVLLKEYLEHDRELRNTGIVNKNANCIGREMFDWTEEEERTFYYSNVERMAYSIVPFENAVYYINKFADNGNEIYILSGRNNGEYKNPYEDTKKWLDKYNIKYKELILTNSYKKYEKGEECAKRNIKILIDDSPQTCYEAIKRGIRVLTMNTRFNQEAEGLDRVSNWEEIYKKIEEIVK